ncbi:ATP-binding cassette domain-containing protein [Halobellus sp. GM3]|uniref:ATP-binding cassette domain-containing protein n=1 Tax=Halobellus sp. GM3 TaxID=3458410 RepID=UPI00403E3095
MTLHTENIKKRFGGLLALDDLSIEVNDGVITGLIGPNGAGKTTLFNIITGTLAPTAGDVVFNGETITNKSAHEIARRGLTRTFQTPQPFFELTVEENVRTARHFGFDGDRGSGTFTVDSVLELLEMDEKRDESPENLQLIEQKYLDFARVLVMEPAVIMLDEMLAGLNPTEKNEFANLVTELHREYDVDFFIIEHDLDLIRKLTDELIVIHEGRLLSSGPTEDVIKDEAVQEAYIA